jgi:anaerobic selenocysteine-containing dehydrogenase
VAKGAWWDPNDTYFGSRQLIITPSGKFEFRSQLLQKELERVSGQPRGKASVKAAAAVSLMAAELGTRSGGKSIPPHDESPPDPKQELDYPMVLNTYKLMSLAGGKGANQPWLQQEPAVHLEGGWDSWVEVNPATAGALKIEDGDQVIVESAKGRIVAMARIFAATAPGILNMPYGWGHTAYGHWARGRGQNPNDVLAGEMDALSGLPAWGGTRVRLRKA